MNSFRRRNGLQCWMQSAVMNKAKFCMFPKNSDLNGEATQNTESHNTHCDFLH